MEPVPRYKIYDIEYKVMYQNAVVNNRTLVAQRFYDERSGHPEKAVDKFVLVTLFLSVLGLR